MKDGLSIVRRIRGDKYVSLSFIPIISSDEVRLVATSRDDDTVSYVLGYAQGGPQGVELSMTVYYGSVPEGTYLLNVLNEDDEVVAKGSLIMFNEDGFSLGAFDAGTPDYLVDGNGDYILDHNEYQILVEA